MAQKHNMEERQDVPLYKVFCRNCELELLCESTFPKKVRLLQNPFENVRIDIQTFEYEFLFDNLCFGYIIFHDVQCSRTMLHCRNCARYVADWIYYPSSSAKQICFNLRVQLKKSGEVPLLR